MADIDILIKFLLDQAAKAQTEKGIDQISEKMKKVGNAFDSDQINKDFDKAFAGFQKSFDESFKDVDGVLVNTKTGIRATREEIQAFGKDAIESLGKIQGMDFTQEGKPANFIESMAKAMEGFQQEEEKIKQGNEDQIQQHQELASLYRSEALILSTQAREERLHVQELKRSAEELGRVSMVAFGSGVAIVGGIFAAADKYVKNAKVATAVTVEWKNAQKELEESGNKVGAVLAERALPLLKDAAALADKAASFVQQHPEIVSAALNTGVVLAALGAVGIAVSKGIRMYADSQYLAAIPLQMEAARLQAKAATEQLAAAQLRNSGINEFGGVNGTTVKTASEASAGGALAGLTSPTGLVLLATAFVATSIKVADQFVALDKASNQLVQDGKPVGVVLGVMSKALQGVVSTWSPLVPAIVNLRESLARDVPLIEKLFNRLTGAADTAAHGTTGGRTPETDSERVSSDTMQKALAIYEKYRDDDLALVQKHYADRNKVVADALAAEQRENDQYSNRVSQINENRANALDDAATNYQKAEERAATRFQEEQARIVRDGEKEIANIREQSQERLRKMELEHGDRVADLTARRDALGLVKENRQYSRDVSEEKRQTQKEIADRRKAIQQRLDDLARSYEEERAQRLEDYQQRVAEINRQADQELKQLQAQHEAELKQIALQRDAKLRELDAEFNAERQRRYQYFLAQIRDLDAGLLGERTLRINYQNAMLKDLDAFLTAYRARLASIGDGSTTSSGTTGARAYGGYATFGNYTLGDTPSGGRGKKEWVVNGDDTETIERALGSQITADKLISAVINGVGGGSSKAVTYNDNRRNDSRISAAERERQRQDTVNTVYEALDL